MAKGKRTENESKMIRPVEPGRIVRFPGDPSRRLRDEGEVVAMSPYWRRRLIAGDVVEVKVESKQSEQQPAANGNKRAAKE